MISKSISWSTCMNFWSHSSMSVVFLRESESSSWGAAGSFLWWSHHSITFLRTVSLTYWRKMLVLCWLCASTAIQWVKGVRGLTLGMGTSALICSSPRSSSKFLIKTDFSATMRSGRAVSRTSLRGTRQSYGGVSYQHRSCYRHWQQEWAFGPWSQTLWWICWVRYVVEEAVVVVRGEVERLSCMKGSRKLVAR